MTSWGSYPHSYNLGHRAVRDLLNYPHVVEEKIDGSQFSFGLFEEHVEPTQAGPTWVRELRVRSKGAVMNVDAPEKMFTKAVATARELMPLLHVGWTYRAEYLAKPHHNTLVYDRVPKGHLILFDVSTGEQEWLSPAEKRDEAERLGLECVPMLNFHELAEPYKDWTFYSPSLDELRHILDHTQSVLGGQLIEGVVIKPLVPLFGVDGHTLMGKFVSERFKESHKLSWRESNPTTGDIVQRLVAAHNTPARYQKAIQHLREAGQLTDSPADIGKLLVELEKDLGREEKDSIMKALWKHFWPQIARGVKKSFPEFYKNELLRRQFEMEAPK